MTRPRRAATTSSLSDVGEVRRAPAAPYDVATGPAAEALLDRLIG